MRVLFGIILGVFLTVGVAYVHDNWSPSTTTGTTASDHRVMVNWDVVNDNLRWVGQRARETWTTLSQKIAS